MIDAATQGAAGIEDVSAVTDTSSLAVIGHSFGGYTALALAGGVGEADPDDAGGCRGRSRCGHQLPR